MVASAPDRMAEAAANKSMSHNPVAGRASGVTITKFPKAWNLTVARADQRSLAAGFADGAGGYATGNSQTAFKFGRFARRCHAGRLVAGTSAQPRQTAISVGPQNNWPHN